MILLAMYQLKSPEAQILLCEAVESLGPSCHFFDSFFLLCASEPPIALQKELRLRVEGQANVFITRLAREHTEHLPREARDWLAAHLDSHTDCSDGATECPDT